MNLQALFTVSMIFLIVAPYLLRACISKEIGGPPFLINGPNWAHQNKVASSFLAGIAIITDFSFTPSAIHSILASLHATERLGRDVESLLLQGLIFLAQ